MTSPNDTTQKVQETYGFVCSELSKIIVGQEPLIKQLFICLLCGGHALIEGVPGLGKTLIVKSLSRILQLKYSRIQFTPDLMPADILGTNIVNQDEKGSRYFEFYKGPIFGQVILADEINRASPKTQSALLEAMQEERITVFGTEHHLVPPFIVLATQNPLEMEGTYPLPEAQIDRFFFKCLVEYPNQDQLVEIIDKTTEEYKPSLNHVVDAETILELKNIVKQVPLASHVKQYAIRIVLASHPENEYATPKTKNFIRYGASPRAVQSLVMAGKTTALLDGRYNVSFDDIRAVAKPTLRHRIILNLKGESEGVDADEITEDIINNISETK